MPAHTNAPSGRQPGKKKGRRARLLVIVLVLALVAGIGYGAYWSVDAVRASLPQTKGSLQLKGLAGPVDVRRDGHGIPQVYASSDEDLFMAQGFVQAQDRFWEMDVRRHTTSGRLSEMFGKGQVKTDEFLRTLGWHRVAQQEYDTKLSASTKKYLQAYAKGVNAYLDGKDGKELSLEYAALGFAHEYTPKKWTPVDSVAWLKAMAWDLRANMQDEIDRALMTSRLGPGQIEDLYPPYPYEEHKPVVREGGYDELTKSYESREPASSGGSGGTGGTAGSGLAGGTTAPGGLTGQLSRLSDALDEVPAVFGPNGNGIGSNSWVVGGKHTITGKPLLANDPHLAPSLPSVWYQMGLHCRGISENCQYDVSGYTFAGMPGVVVGHNQKISWGVTNLGADVSDLYLEKFSGDGYTYDGKTRPFTTRKETIEVADGPDKTITVRETNNGPLISDRSDELREVGRKADVDAAAPDRGAGYGISLKWTALSPGRTMDAVFAFDKAQSWQEFRSAAKLFEVPSQNLVYADTEGNIGYQAPGRIPVRAKGDGSLPAPGWDPAYRWDRWIQQDELPYEFNPERGYIVAANQAVVDEKYPYTLTTDWGYGTRSQRIDDLIRQKTRNGGKISTEDMRLMQTDNSSEIAKLLTPELLKIDISDSYVRQAQKLLEGWDYTQDPDSGAAAYFNAVWRNILKLAFGNKLPKEVRVEGQCLSVEPADNTGPADEDRLVRECGERDDTSAQPDGGDRWSEVVRRLFDDEKSDWWKTPASRTDKATETRDQLFARAMEDARWDLTAKLGKDVDTWSWGRLHKLELKNQTLGKEGPGLVKFLLNRGPWDLGGGEAAVNATGWNAANGYGVVWVPSMRMVVNLDDLDKSKWINLTGASGHAYSDHYTDQTDAWAKGELFTWEFSERAVKKAAKDTLVLKP
ncbi:penicillin acylase family protein [Streptomyces physcomitrii]|uniref:Penicillin acylase family protein n=1 Tax=Streptomyces physcomitrii TaxID=2724184 RepID=A0ABX1H5K7_9ACTN|nr:penicillin acylase family protein [Streptomyces physcomitrii]NKI43342.1 penicillin acylase family protein [Streptomyces physcomitrii]